MLTDGQKKVCDEILKYGEIISDISFVSEGDFIRQYIIEDDDCIFHLTKINGDWVYIHREI